MGEIANNIFKKKKSFVFIFKPELTSGVTNYQEFQYIKPADRCCSPGMAGTRQNAVARLILARLGAIVHIKSHMDTLTRSKWWQEFLEVILGVPLTIGYI